MNWAFGIFSAWAALFFVWTAYRIRLHAHRSHR
jgi:hypothetical protein